MTYQIIATHNPQDFFEGIEPEDLPKYYEATNENLSEIVSKCINGGYVVIIYPKEGWFYGRQKHFYKTWQKHNKVAVV